jgi:hypothetical protein
MPGVTGTNQPAPDSLAPRSRAIASPPPGRGFETAELPDGREPAHPGDVAARPVDAADKAAFDSSRKSCIGLATSSTVRS